MREKTAVLTREGKISRTKHQLLPLSKKVTLSLCSYQLLLTARPRAQVLIVPLRAGIVNSGLCGGEHSCCEFVWVTVMSCSEASLSQCSSPFFGFSHSFFPHGLPDRSLSLEASKDHTEGSSVPRHSRPVILSILNSLNLRVYFLYKEFYKPNKKCSVFIQTSVEPHLNLTLGPHTLRRHHRH